MHQIGQSKNAKRTAIAHSIFNISGSCVFIFLVPWFAKFVQFISPKGNEIDVISRQIANAHTTFKYRLYTGLAATDSADGKNCYNNHPWK